MRSRALALSLLLVAGAAHTQDEQDIRRRLTELTAENVALKRRVAVLADRLNALYAERAGVTHTMHIRIPFDGEPEPEHLRGIELPDPSSKQEVRLYVARILRAAARHRNGYGADDPEVRLLTKVGPANVDVLIEPLLYDETRNASLYVTEALKALVREEHKALVLQTLPLVRDLVVVVQARGWTADAAPTLLKVLADQESWTLPNANLPTEWIEAVAELKRPESYGDLKTYLYYGANRYHTWKAIRDLPGMDVTAEVERLWPWARELKDNWVRTGVAAIAAHYGHMDALEVLFEDPADWPEFEVIEEVTPYRSEWPDSDRAKEWFKVHRNQLVFDAAERKYRVVTEEGAAPGAK